MNRFKGFVIKEFFHILRDPRTLLILIGIPVAQIMIFGFVISNDIKDVHIAIYDQSNDEVTREITNKIISSGYFILDEPITHHNQIEKRFKRGIVREVIVFEQDFAEKLEREGNADLQIIADASDANTANLISNFTQAIVSDYLRKLNVNSQVPLKIETEARMLFNEEMKGVYMFVPGTMALILMLISTMMTSISIAKEKEFGTMEVLLVSPLKPIQIIIGKVAPYVALAFLDAVLILIMGIYVFKMPLLGSTLLLLLASLLYILMALSLGILISTIVKTQQVAMFISLIGLLLPTMLLSGFIFPIENMPLVLQWVANILPFKYFIVMIKDIMLKGVGMAYIWKEVLILIGFTVFFIVVSVKKFKLRLE
ncbi:MAG: ABC transporter permease [Bacteroidetes bacterium]|jgi:ABC-2 type transport system permease protein|nr:ABC transporter permease [Bacteroidota bacterium]MBT5529676.1 ABC transporter permease [Cytophagia bacterium]MBT3423177.1 ABC transporter permease [Bacteroidota bacterium]MBT3802199.1 ABC transporter permease [Bacteroidota bacterium]MBT3935367.1 ABC transporter permease [Bacteroidota bacterium]